MKETVKFYCGYKSENKHYISEFKKSGKGIPAMAQQKRNLIRNHEVVGSIPSLTHSVLL